MDFPNGFYQKDPGLPNVLPGHSNRLFNKRFNLKCYLKSYIFILNFLNNLYFYKLFSTYIVTLFPPSSYQAYISRSFQLSSILIVSTINSSSTIINQLNLSNRLHSRRLTFYNCSGHTELIDIYANCEFLTPLFTIFPTFLGENIHNCFTTKCSNCLYEIIALFSLF